MDINGTRSAARHTSRSSIDGVQAARISSRATASPARQAHSPAVPKEHMQFPLPRYYAPERPAKIVRKRLRKRVLFLRSAGIVTVLMLGTSGFLGWKAYAKLHKVFRGTSTVAALASKPVTPNLLKGEGDGRVNILLLGIGGPGHDGPDLTDTIVILSVDPVNNTAAMVSIPRDLWVKQPVNYFGAEQKINAAYESGKYHYLGKLDASGANASAVEAGFSSIDQVVKNVVDVNINYHMLVNFQAFRQAVDTVGGVSVDVPTELYDPTMAWENHNSPILASAGVQQMDGVKALLYARSRETTSDFARGQRQRQILIALKDKVLTAGTLSNPTKIDGLMNAFGDNVYSDLSTQGASRLFTIMKKVSDTKIGSIGLTDEPHKLVTTDHINATSVVRPVAGFNNYTDIQSYVRSQMPDGFLVKENASISVVARTQAGATATANLLKNYGYNVTAAITTTQPIAPTTLVDLSKGTSPFTLHYLEDRYGIKVVPSLPAGISLRDTSSKFVIIEPK
jgi:LCP family protein required for cell wall assembly